MITRCGIPNIDALDHYWSNLLGCNMQQLIQNPLTVTWTDRSPGMIRLQLTGIHTTVLSLASDLKQIGMKLKYSYGPAAVLYASVPRCLDRRFDTRWMSAAELEQFCILAQRPYPASTLVSGGIGAFVDGQPVSIAGIQVWDNLIGELFVATLPEFRQQGYGHAAVAACTNYLLEETELIPQYDTEITNKPSLRVALGCGYQLYGYLTIANLTIAERTTA